MVGQVDEGRLVAGRYRLLERIGRGGMGTVWRAEDELLGRLVAVKKLHPPQPHMDDDELATLFERTRREARAAARISHPNVIVVHDVVDDDGLPSIVMEYVPSLTLGERLKQQGALPVPEVARIGRGMIAALRAAHHAGVLHRDVKPGNVLLGEPGSSTGTQSVSYEADGTPVEGPGGRVVLTDFGIAQASGTSTLTRTGELIGSIDFLSPERIRGVPPGPEADLWALGATLFQAVKGVSPFRRPTAIETAYAIAEEPVPELDAGALTQVIAGLLAKEPEQRLSAEDAERMLRLPAAEADTALVDRARFQQTKPPAPDPSGDTTGHGASHGAPPPSAYGQQGTYGGPGAYAGGQTGQTGQTGPTGPGTYGGGQTGPTGQGAYAGGQTAHTGSGAYGGPGAYGYPQQGGGYEPPTGQTQQTPQPAPGRRSRRAGRWIAAAVAIAVLAAGTAVLVGHYRSRGDDAGRPTPSPTPPTSGPATPTSTAPTTPATPTTPPSSPPAVPDGYHLASVPDRGYSVPVPDGWTRQKAGPKGDDEVNWVSPDGKSGLKVSALDFGTSDPYQHLVALEPQTQSQVDDYHRERLDSTQQFGGPAAIWEFTFQGSKRRYHAIDLDFGKPGGIEYAVYLNAPDAKWQEQLPVFQNAVAGFRLSGQ
jgi:tRNA A-37 threonylcarbamoyl transferase component Bud32